MVVVAGLAVFGSACGGDDNEPPSGDPPSPGTQETTTTLSPEAEVEEAYLAYWDMLDRLGAAPDPDDPEIAERAYGDALLDVVQSLTRAKELGHLSETGSLYAHSVESVEVAGDQAVLQDCVIDDGIIVDEATGEVVGGGDVAAKLLEVTLASEEDRWKVSRVDRIPTEPSATSCEE